MIRKAIIVALTLAAVGSGVLLILPSSRIFGRINSTFVYHQPSTKIIKSSYYGIVPTYSTAWQILRFSIDHDSINLWCYRVGDWIPVTDESERTSYHPRGGGVFGMLGVPTNPLGRVLLGPMTIYHYVEIGEEDEEADLKATVQTAAIQVTTKALFVAFAAYPTVALIRYVRGPLRRYRRRRKGLCLKCGYDLTGNVSGVCPECGEAM